MQSCERCLSYLTPGFGPRELCEHTREPMEPEQGASCHLYNSIYAPSAMANVCILINNHGEWIVDGSDNERAASVVARLGDGWTFEEGEAVAYHWFKLRVPVPENEVGLVGVPANIP